LYLTFLNNAVQQLDNVCYCRSRLIVKLICRLTLAMM